ncbi:hypothetical protein [Mesorhizobium sp.]|uniref:hypothetical protein n=1 Tax=Mesorhizobium sp. TaxID=1871066 RepID=UPI0026BEFDD7
MPTSHDLNGLMKFLSRDEWRECFEEVFDEHFGPILGDGDMEFEELAEVLGDDRVMNLWGCAFEDFLTQDFEGEPSNIVDEYLKRRGWKENAQTRAYMGALRTSVMSLYEVSDVVPGQSFMARGSPRWRADRRQRGHRHQDVEAVGQDRGENRARLRKEYPYRRCSSLHPRGHPILVRCPVGRVRQKERKG